MSSSFYHSPSLDPGYAQKGRIISILELILFRL